MKIKYLLMLCMCFVGSLAYKPVVILHGILSGAESMTVLVRHIEKVSAMGETFLCYCSFVPDDEFKVNS